MAHELDPGAPGELYQVVIHVDAPVLADPEAPGQSLVEDGAHVPAETCQHLACDAASASAVARSSYERGSSSGRHRSGRRPPSTITDPRQQVGQRRPLRGRLVARGADVADGAAAPVGE